MATEPPSSSSSSPPHSASAFSNGDSSSIPASSAIDFLSLCHRLKTMKRTRWVRRDVENPESIADHMYRMGLMALIASDIPGVDQDKLGFLLLLGFLCSIWMKKITVLRSTITNLQPKAPFSNYPYTVRLHHLRRHLICHAYVYFNA
ncbi:hypothetical protein LOK49_LG06G01228 [Camellia lanceoleosa]|uniref:Uncharacterized protein n=1 Tax=Camellia lanceoleosa TaxID=1840588 RepID=A0ACC0HH93_9ERIC|nr:hypothetical protein LOK49_LG06G01228 [Camellia lanceoleosa]